MPETVFCSTCSSALISSHSAARYLAMPSEHWEELIDSWMCHSDQLLNLSVTKGREGIQEGKQLKPDEVRVFDSFVVWDASRAIEGAIPLPSKVSCSAVSLLDTSYKDQKKVGVVPN